MKNVRLTSRAYRDLTAIANYLEEQAPDAAPVVMQRIQRALNQIARFPHMGRPGRRENTREFLVQRLPFLIVYRVTDSVIEVLTIFHTARDPEQI